MKRIVLSLPLYTGAAALAYHIWPKNQPLAVVLLVLVAIFSFAGETQRERENERNNHKTHKR